jgi:predicted RND superfamily exporter protein
VYINNKKKLQLYKKEQRVIKEKIDVANDRESLESVYQLKKEIEHYYDVDRQSFRLFVNVMNDIQYKPEWTDEDLARAKRSLNRMSGELREKRGI